MSHQSSVRKEELCQQEGVIENKQERVSKNKQDYSAEAQKPSASMSNVECGLEPHIGKQSNRRKERQRVQDKVRCKD